ncbi:hypothetical protein EC988_009290, partial [Linderina pennispora]
MVADTPEGSIRNQPSPMAVATPSEIIVDTPQPSALPPGPRVLLESDPIRVHLSVDIASAPEALRAGLAQIIESHSVPYFVQQADQYSWTIEFAYRSDILEGEYQAEAAPSSDGSAPQVLIRYHRTIDAFRALGQ